MIVEFLWIALASYFVYKILFDFIIPVVGTTRRMRRAFQESQQRQTDAFRNAQGQDPSSGRRPGSVDPGDYIDFEEIK